MPTSTSCLPVARGYRQPLAAGYRPTLAPLIERLVAEGNLRPGMLFEHCRVEEVSDAELLAHRDVARFDPDLDSVVNLNTPEDYTAARQRLPPEVVVQCYGALGVKGYSRPPDGSGGDTRCGGHRRRACS